MTTYKSIVGQKILKVSSDPTDPLEGQIWYNSKTGRLKGVPTLKAWSSGGPVITARFGTAGGVSDQGTQSSTIFFGGQEPSFSNKTEEYNGTGSSSAPNLPAAVAENMGCGTSTAALSFGGLSNPSTHIAESYEYDGSSWGSETDLNTSRYTGGGAGSQTAGLACGGYSTTHLANTEEYNGSAWTNVNSMNTARYSFGTAGVQTSAVIAAGVTTTRVNSVEEYDGTNWTSGTNYPVTTGGTQGFGATNTTAIFAGGSTSPPTLITTCLAYDGSSFSAVPSLSNSASGGYASGSNSAGLYLSGIRTAPGTAGSDVEEYNSSATVVTGGAWASGGTLNQARYQMAGAGTTTAGLAFGGYGPAETGKTEEYNGFSFSEQNDMGTARYEMGNGNGTQTAALCTGGRTTTGAQAFVEEYNGTSWSEVNDLPADRVAHGSTGTQTASLIALGKAAPGGPTLATSLEYDGTNWTSGGTANTARSACFGAGTQTSAIFAGGNPALTTAEEYNGSAWTTTGSLVAGTTGASTAGADSDAALFTSGGNGGQPSGVSETSLYNGTSFVTAPKLASERGYAAGFGIQSSALVAGGLRSTGVNTTEEFTGESTAANVEIITTS